MLALAHEEAQRLNHNYIGTQHLLLGRVRGGDDIAAEALANQGLDLDSVRARSGSSPSSAVAADVLPRRRVAAARGAGQ